MDVQANASGGRDVTAGKSRIHNRARKCLMCEALRVDTLLSMDVVENRSETDQLRDLSASLRILIADDHPAMREAIYDSVIDFGEVVGVAHNGQQAVDFVERLEPDVVVMDLRMPILDGIEATRIIKANHPRVRVVVYTAYDDRALLEEVIAAGADACALKGEDLDTSILRG
ncbi:MAG: hypothetical protein DCC49_11600 [Acidobacteria bacterium]|nr:MAG: hypothetical protein DCC49_11600 [Acidobacteriota bacterium]